MKSSLGSSAVSTNPESPAAEQLLLELEQASSPKCGSSIVRFVDAETRAVRQNAIERVKISGIFELPKSALR